MDRVEATGTYDALATQNRLATLFYWLKFLQSFTDLSFFRVRDRSPRRKMFDKSVISRRKFT